MGDIAELNLLDTHAKKFVVFELSDMRIAYGKNSQRKCRIKAVNSLPTVTPFSLPIATP